MKVVVVLRGCVGFLLWLWGDSGDGKVVVVRYVWGRL